MRLTKEGSLKGEGFIFDIRPTRPCHLLA